MHNKSWKLGFSRLILLYAFFSAMWLLENYIKKESLGFLGSVGAYSYKLSLSQYITTSIITLIVLGILLVGLLAIVSIIITYVRNRIKDDIVSSSNLFYIFASAFAGVVIYQIISTLFILINFLQYANQVHLTRYTGSIFQVILLAFSYSFVAVVITRGLIIFKSRRLNYSVMIVVGFLAFGIILALNGGAWSSHFPKNQIGLSILVENKLIINDSMIVAACDSADCVYQNADCYLETNGWLCKQKIDILLSKDGSTNIAAAIDSNKSQNVTFKLGDKRLSEMQIAVKNKFFPPKILPLLITVSDYSSKDMAIDALNEIVMDTVKSINR